MDKNYIEQNAIDTKYLRNQLTPEQSEEFEVYLLDHPEMLEQLELDAVLGSELPDVASVKSQAVSLSSWFAPAGVVTGFLASSLCFTVFASFMLAGSPLAPAPHMYADITRGVALSDTTTLFELDQRNFEFFGKFRKDHFVLSLDTSSIPPATYRAQVSSNLAESSTVAATPAVLAETVLQIKPYQAATFTLLAHSYPPGAYKITLSKLAETDGQAYEFYFRTKVIVEGSGADNER